MISWKQQELNKEVKLVFWQMAVFLARQQLLVKLDSVYSRVLQAAALRLKAGETNMLEKVTVEAQVQQLKIQQQQLQGDIIIAQQKLQWLLNTEEKLLPDYTKYTEYNGAGIVIVDTAAVSNHPLIKFREQQVMLAGSQTALDRNKLVPDIAARL